MTRTEILFFFILNKLKGVRGLHENISSCGCFLIVIGLSGFEFPVPTASSADFFETLYLERRLKSPVRSFPIHSS